MTAKLQETETRLATCEGYIDKVKKDIVKTEQLIQEKKDAVKVLFLILFSAFLYIYILDCYRESYASVS